MLGTRFPVHDTHLPLAMYYKSLLFFFKHFKISQKVQKKLKNQKVRQEIYVIFGSSQVVSPSNKVLYITSIGWVNILTLGDVLISLGLSPPIG